MADGINTVALTENVIYPTIYQKGADTARYPHKTLEVTGGVVNFYTSLAQNSPIKPEMTLELANADKNCPVIGAFKWFLWEAVSGTPVVKSIGVVSRIGD